MKKKQNIKASVLKKISLSILIIFSFTLTIIYFINNNSTRSKVLLEGASGSDNGEKIGEFQLKATLTKLSNLNKGSEDKFVTQEKDDEEYYLDKDLTMDLSKKDLKSENGGGKVKAEYSIALKENPVINGSQKIGKDVAILIDLDMGSKLGSEATSDILNGFVDRIFNSSDFEITDGSVNFCVIPYNAKEVKEVVDPQSPGNNPREKLHRSLLYCKGNMINNSDYIDKNEGHGIDEGLEQALSFFKNGDLDSSKMIIIVSKLKEDDGSDVKLSDYTKAVKDFADSNINYSAITIGLSYIGYDKSENFDDDYKSKLKNLHDDLNGDEYAYHVSNADKQGESPHHDIYNGEFDIENKGVIQRVGEDIKGYFNNKSISRNTDLCFDMGDYIIPVNADSNGSINPHEYIVAAPKMTFKYDYSIDENKKINISKNEQQDILKLILENIENEDNAKDVIKNNFKNKFRSIKNIRDLDEHCIKVADNIVNSVTENLDKKVYELSIDGKINNTILKDVQDYTVKQLLSMDDEGKIDEKAKIKAGAKIKLIISDFLKKGFESYVNDEFSSILSSAYKNTIHYIDEGDKTVSFDIKPIDGIGNFIEGLDESPYIRFMDNDRDSFEGNNYYNYTYYDALKKSDGKTKTSINSIPVLGIAVSSLEVDHGVYKGMEEDEEQDWVADLEKGHSLVTTGDSKSNTLSFADGATVTFAANIRNMTSEADIELTIDSNLEVCQPPKVYKNNNDGTLKFLENAIFTKGKNNTDSVNKYTMKFDGVVNNDIVILYSVKVNQLEANKKEFTNTIKAKVEKETKTNGKIQIERIGNTAIYSGNKSLPDLF